MSDRLVQFLYLVGRDHLPLGAVEAALARTTEEPAIYSNEFLAAWARNVADRLAKSEGDV